MMQYLVPGCGHSGTQRSVLVSKGQIVVGQGFADMNSLVLFGASSPNISVEVGALLSPTSLHCLCTVHHAQLVHCASPAQASRKTSLLVLQM